jgi:DNA-binding response OmpR family regulator
MPGHKILVIDDSKTIGMSIENMLLTGNFEITEAKDGLEGCDLLHRESPKLIILNLLMPKMSGWEVYQEIQKQQTLRTIPLMFMSGRKEELTDKISEPFEYFAFIEKPFCQKQLFDAMREAMMKAHKYSQTLSATPSYFPPPLSAVNVDSHEFVSLTEKITSLETELEHLKEEMNDEFTGCLVNLALEVEHLKKQLKTLQPVVATRVFEKLQ